MRNVVMAAAVAFSPRLGLTRGPFPKITRRVAHAVLAFLDRRREVIDQRPVA